MNPDDLFAQSDRLLTPMGAGALKSADKRRAISTAYYAVFHTVAAAVADELVGKTSAARKTKAYAVVYRSVGHERLRRLCAEAGKPIAKGALSAHWPKNGFGADLKAFAAVFVKMIQRRHDADYDPAFRVDLATARDLVADARAAVASFAAAPVSDRKLFAVLTVCDPRG